LHFSTQSLVTGHTANKAANYCHIVDLYVFFLAHPKEKIFSADLKVEAGHGEVLGLMFDELQNHSHPETLNNFF